MTAEELEQYMDTYSLELLKLAIVYVKDKQVAEDIVQDVFIQLYYSNTYEEQGKLGSYLKTLTVNRCKNYLKSWSYRMMQLKETVIERGTKKRDALVLQEERAYLTKQLFALPLQYREVIYFYYYEELKVKDIASVLSVPENTVKTRLRKARSLLKEALPNEAWEVLQYDETEEGL